MSNKISNIAYNKRTNQFCPIAYTTTYGNSKQIVHKVARGSFQMWPDSEVEFLTIHQVEKLMDYDDSWEEPSEDTVRLLGFTPPIKQA